VHTFKPNTEFPEIFKCQRFKYRRRNNCLGAASLTQTGGYDHTIICFSLHAYFMISSWGKKKKRKYVYGISKWGKDSKCSTKVVGW
jgi:hypothetical protein